jgi:cyclohexanecarboxylate-CoA ligase
MRSGLKYSLAVANPALTKAYYQKGYWRTGDLWTSVEAVVARDPQAVAFVEGGRCIRFGEMMDLARRFGAAARRHGLDDGDVVVIHGRNCIEAVVAILGCASAGLVSALLPSMFSVTQIRSVLDITDGKLILSLGEEPELERARAALATRPETTFVIPDDSTRPESARVWSQFIATGSGAEGSRRSMPADDLAMLIFSSGTTGAPKGVMHSCNTARFAAEQYSACHDIGPRDTCLIVLAFGFVGSSILGILVPLLKGCRGILLRRWSVDETLRLISEYRASHIFLMPTHAIDVLASPVLNESDCSSVLRGVLAGLTESQRVDAKNRLCTRPFPMYGMSESPGHVTGSMDDDWNHLLRTEGRALPGTELRICDDADDPVPPGTKGSILVRGPNRFLGYYRAEDLTADSLTADGYFRTGDIGVLDHDGYMTFISRSKDIIRRGGVTIIPAEIEAVLQRHPRIRDVAVIGLPDTRLGEQACVCVISRDGQDIQLDEITGFLEQRGFARYSWPEHVAVCQEFPRTPSLKVKKNELRELVLAMMSERDRAAQSGG